MSPMPSSSLLAESRSGSFGSYLIGMRMDRAGDGHFFTMCSSGLLGKFRWLNRRLPSDPRCRLCLVPFGGLGKLLRVTASRKNPNFCTGCFEMAPVGGHETTIGVLFADIRGYTCEVSARSTSNGCSSV